MAASPDGRRLGPRGPGLTKEGRSLEHLAWPPQDIGLAVDALARAMRLVGPGVAPLPIAVVSGDLDSAVVDATEVLGLAGRRWRVTDGEAQRWLGRHRCALVHLQGQGILVIAAAKGGDLEILGPDRRRRRVSIADVLQVMGASLPAGDMDDLEQVLESSGMMRPAARRVAAAARSASRSDRHFSTAWTLAVSPGHALSAQTRKRWMTQAAVVLSASLAETACVVLAWWVLGRRALDGHVDEGWLTAFLLLLLTALPLRALGRTAQGRLAFGFGAALQARLFLGALRLRPEEVRGEGSGRMLARVFESVRLQSMGLGAAFAALTGAVQLPIAFWVLAQGRAPWAGPLLLAAAVLAVTGVSVALLRRQRVWTRLRAAHTESLVELMLGHRTRIAQEARGMRHQREDAELARLVEMSSAVDDAALPLLAVIPRSFFIAGVLAQAAGALTEGGLAPMAVGLGGVLLGHGALTVICLGARQLCAAILSAEQVRSLSDAAGRGLRPPSPEIASLLASEDSRQPVLRAHEVAFRHPGRRRAAVAGVDISIAQGERVLLEGPSGSGKSTLLSLLGGLRIPAGGSLRLKGLDARLWGDSWWKRQVVLVPQFHENHVFAAPLAFNVLLGRGWPPAPEDLTEADAVCRDLGLGPLIERMPSGLMQPVGETGWQLSHGERARVFLARGLLQRAELILLDETFAALDPETLRIALECSRRRARTLLVVAHP